MKINFRKISALATSMLMVGMTAGVAAAANYPAPFVVGGAADVAVVYGTGAGVSVLDTVEAGNIQSNLQSFLSGSGGGSSVSGGDSFKFEKTSTKFHLGDTITGVISTAIDEDELPVLLADGIFVDDDNDEFDFTQKIDMAASQLTMFEDNDYIEDQPSVGFKITSGTNILNYTIEFSDEPAVGDLATADLMLMGKTYYILTQTLQSDGALTLTLLDSAEDTTLEEGSSTSLNGKSVTIDFISETEVVLIIDGEATNSLQETETQKLTDGSYVGIKDIRFSSKKGTLSSVEFSIGSGKLKLQSGSDIQINDDSVSGLSSTIVNSSTGLTSIALVWDADDDLFIAEDTDAVLPEFETVKLSYGGLNYPTEEVVEVQQGGDLYAVLENFPLKDGTVDINFLYGTTAGSFLNLGKDANNRLRTHATNVSFDKDTDDYFVASWDDGTDAESYLMRANNFVTESNVDKVDFQYYKNGAWTDKKTKAKNADTFSIGNVDLLIGGVSKTGKTVYIERVGSNTNFNTLYSATGLKVYLPYVNSTDQFYGNNTETTAALACSWTTSVIGELFVGNIEYNDSSTSVFTNVTSTTCTTSFELVMYEEDKNGNTAKGSNINATVGWDGSATKEVEVSSIQGGNATSTEILDTDVHRDFTYSALATEILFNKPSGSAQNSVKIVYHGDEVAADVFITSSDAVISGGSGGGSLGDVLVTDNEVSSVSSKNLIVVGGSCINSVAANLVGGALCGSAWTSSTSVGSGEFLIQSFGGAYSSGKIALLVAGYGASDTVNAATYLKNNAVNTDAGSKYIGTSSTSAQMQVA